MTLRPAGPWRGGVAPAGPPDGAVESFCAWNVRAWSGRAEGRPGCVCARACACELERALVRWVLVCGKVLVGVGGLGGRWGGGGGLARACERE